MPADLLRLPVRDGSGALHVVVETPAGSRVKLKYSPQLGTFVLSRPLVLGVSYPFDWGFVPGTRASDGDPVDAMIVSDTATFEIGTGAMTWVIPSYTETPAPSPKIRSVTMKLQK